MTLLHARFWNYDGNHHMGHNCERYDPHGFGLNVITAMAYIADDWQQHYGDCVSEYGQYIRAHKGNLSSVVVKHHRGDDFGHQIHVAATREQWESLIEAIKAVDALYEPE